MSPNPRITLVQWNILLMVLLGDAHHVADDLQRQRAGQLGDHLARPSGCVSIIVLDEATGALSRTEASVRATTLGVNALLTMLRSRRCRGSSITIIDPKYSDRSGFPSLITMLGLGAEDVRMAAGVPDIVVPGHRPVAGAWSRAAGVSSGR